MSIVGQFPGITSRRRVLRAQINPLDKTTVISVFPKEILETKYTIQPGVFLIPRGSVEKPSSLIVGPSSWWREIDEDQPLLEIPQSSISVADALVRDYCNSVLGYVPDNASPGLFYIPGEHTIEEAQKNFKSEFDGAIQRQNNWYTALINLADSLWARSNGNPRAISDDMRLAAREMNQTTRDWMKDFKLAEMVRCKACGALKNPEYPVCGSCRNVDMSHPAAKELKFAQ